MEAEVQSSQVWIYVEFRKDEDGFLGVAPGLRGCVTWAPTLAQARVRMLDAIRGYLATVSEHGLELAPNAYLRTTPPSGELPAVEDLTRSAPSRPGATTMEWCKVPAQA